MSPMNFICEYYVDLLFTSNDCFNSRLIVIHHAEIHKLAILVGYGYLDMDLDIWIWIFSLHRCIASIQKAFITHWSCVENFY